MNSDWTEHVIELDIPTETENISLGVNLGANGTVWIDGLRIEIDGETWRGSDRIDLEFETENLTGWFVDDKNLVTRDPGTTRAGRPTLRIRPATPIPSCATTAEEAARRSVEIHEDLVAREAELAATLSREWAACAIRNARMIVQAWEIRTGGGDPARVRSMAENVLWSLERGEGAKVVFWAHNMHVGRGGGETGAHLARALGRDYVPVVFTTTEGTYLALDPRWSSEFGQHPLAEPPPESFEARLHSDGKPRRILDLRSVRADDPDLGFLTESRPFRIVGASALPEQFFEQRIRDGFDLLVYLERTTAARLLPRID